MKIALFKNTRYSFSFETPAGEWMEHSEEFARITDYVDVEFPPLSDGAVIQQQLDALSRTEQALREKFQGELNGIKTRRAELLALTHVPEAS